jgi:integrase/recombinase XerD
MKIQTINKRRKGSAADLPDRAVSLALAQARAQTNHAERNAAIVMVSVSLGLRAGEIAQLLWKFVLDDDGKIGNTLHLPNEVSKWRSGADLPMSKQLQNALQALYKAQSKDHPITPTDHIFRSQKGGGISRQSVVDLFRLIWKKAGVDASSHSGRRFFITKCARNVSACGGSLRDVMALARHKHLSTTQLYVAQNTKAQTALVDLVSRGIR